MKRLLLIALVAWCAFGACNEPSGPVILGGSVDAVALKLAVVDFGAMREVAPGQEVVLQGTVGEVCPAGCWFYLHSPDDLIYVDVLGDFKVPREATGRVALIKGVTDGEGGSRILKAQRVVLSQAPVAR
jgi:hypothetical protein